MFSYGSGSASAMFSARIRRNSNASKGDKQADPYTLEGLVDRLQDVRYRLTHRRCITPEEFTAILKCREEAYGKGTFTNLNFFDFSSCFYFQPHMCRKVKSRICFPALTIWPKSTINTGGNIRSRNLRGRKEMDLSMAEDS